MIVYFGLAFKLVELYKKNNNACVFGACSSAGVRRRWFFQVSHIFLFLFFLSFFYNSFFFSFRGIAAFFRPLIRLFQGSAISKSADVLRKVANKPIAKKLIKQTKKEIGKTALNVVSDILDGSHNKNTLKNHGLSTLKNIGTSVLKNPKKERKFGSKDKRGKKRKRTVFD